MANTGLIIRTQDRRRLPGAGAIVLPDALSSGLILFHILMDGLANAKRSWAAGIADATIVGNPTEADGYCSFTSAASYLRAASIDSAQGTLLVVGRDTGGSADGAHTPIFIGSYGGGGALGGSSIYNQSGGLTASAAYSNGGANTILAAQQTKLPQNSWSCLMSDWSTPAAGVGAVHLYDQTRGLQGNSANYTGNRVQNGLGYGIGTGGAGGGGFGGTSDIALAMGWSRVLTAAERATIYAFAKTLAATATVPITI